MVSYTHLPIVVMCFFLLMFMRRWWLCIDRMMPFVLAAADWFSITLPGQSTAVPSMLAVVMSLACVGSCLFILKNTGERFAGSWAGTRESALRTIAALRIIDAAELAHALQYVQARETANAGRVIDAETLREVRK